MKAKKKQNSNQEQVELVVGFSFGRTFMGTFRGSVEQLRARVSNGQLVKLHDAIEVSGQLFLHRVVERPAIETPGAKPVEQLQLNHGSRPHLIGHSPGPVAVLHVILSGYYTARDLDDVSAMELAASYVAIRDAGRATLKRLGEVQRAEIEASKEGG